MPRPSSSCGASCSTAIPDPLRTSPASRRSSTRPTSCC